MRKTSTLTGNNNIAALPTGDVQVNHLRPLPAWLRCKYMLDEDMYHGFMNGATLCVQNCSAGRPA